MSWSLQSTNIFFSSSIVFSHRSISQPFLLANNNNNTPRLAMNIINWIWLFKTRKKQYTTITFCWCCTSCLFDFRLIWLKTMGRWYILTIQRCKHLSQLTLLQSVVTQKTNVGSILLSVAFAISINNLLFSLEIVTLNWWGREGISWYEQRYSWNIWDVCKKLKYSAKFKILVSSLELL